MQWFAVTYRGGPEWPDGVPSAQHEAVRSHLAYLQANVRATVAFHAPFRDRDGILAILMGDSLDALIEDLRADPLVRDGVLVLEVHSMVGSFVASPIPPL